MQSARAPSENIEFCAFLNFVLQENTYRQLISLFVTLNKTKTGEGN